MNTIHKYSRLTHAHVRSQMACGIYGYVLMQLLDFRSKRMIPQFIKEVLEYYRKSEKFKNELHYFKRLIQDDFENLDRSQIKSTGYVVHTLEAVFWSVLNSTDYSNAVFTAVNLGSDTDTVAAITGGLAACLYDDVPEEMTGQLLRVDYILELCKRFCDAPEYKEPDFDDLLDFGSIELDDLEDVDTDDEMPIMGQLEAGPVPEASFEEICQMKIEELDLSVRAYNCLKRAGIDNIREIVDLGYDKLSTVRNLGKIYLDEILLKLEGLGVKIHE